MKARSTAYSMLVAASEPFGTNESPPIVDVFLFRAWYRDGFDIEIALNPEFLTIQAATVEAMLYTKALGQMPSVLRKGIETFSVHKGSEGFHAGTGQIIVYSDTASVRMKSKHLEESIFHEAVHASWDDEHRMSSGWIKAQKSDAQFMTQYAQAVPEREDLAETALFAYGILHFPGRIPPADTQDIMSAVPMRIRYIEKLVPTNQPIFIPFAIGSQCV